jgi:hypothetical protein
MAQCIKPGGKVLIDYLNVHYVEERLAYNEIKKLDGTEYEIHRWHDDDFFYKRIIVKDNSLQHPVEYTEKVAKFSLGDFTEMLSFQNLQVKEVFGDYHLNGYSVSATPRMIIVASKKGN